MSDTGKQKTASEIEIENKTLRDAVVDRDRALASKEKEIAVLGAEIQILKEHVSAISKHHLSEDEEKAKAALSDYEATVELMASRTRKPLGVLRLYDVVRNAVVALDSTRDERDTYKGAFEAVESAAIRARNVAEGRS